MSTPVRLLLLALLLLCPSPALRADGGVVRLSERQGGYRITVFTAPNPFRAGPVDISVLVQDAETGEALPDAGVTVCASPRGRPGDSVSCRATTEAATNKLLRAALFELPGPGWWEADVTVEGPRGAARVRFEVEAAGPAPRWVNLWPWVGWPAVAVLLFCIHQRLARRHRRPSRAAPSTEWRGRLTLGG